MHFYDNVNGFYLDIYHGRRTCNGNPQALKKFHPCSVYDTARVIHHGGITFLCLVWRHLVWWIMAYLPKRLKYRAVERLGRN